MQVGDEENAGLDILNAERRLYVRTLSHRHKRDSVAKRYRFVDRDQIHTPIRLQSIRRHVDMIQGFAQKIRNLRRGIDTCAGGRERSRPADMIIVRMGQRDGE